jgi:hypothetical protein
MKTCLVSGVVDQDVDAAKFAYCLANDGTAMLRILNIAGNEHGFLSGFLNPMPRVRTR